MPYQKTEVIEYFSKATGKPMVKGQYVLVGDLACTRDGMSVIVEIDRPEREGELPRIGLRPFCEATNKAVRSCIQ